MPLARSGVSVLRYWHLAPAPGFWAATTKGLPRQLSSLLIATRNSFGNHLFASFPIPHLFAPFCSQWCQNVAQVTQTWKQYLATINKHHVSASCQTCCIYCMFAIRRDPKGGRQVNLFTTVVYVLIVMRLLLMFADVLQKWVGKGVTISAGKNNKIINNNNNNNHKLT